MTNQFIDYITGRDSKKIREYRESHCELMNIVIERDHPDNAELKKFGQETKELNQFLNSLSVENPTFKERVLEPVGRTAFLSFMAGTFYMADDNSLLQIGGIGLCAFGLSYNIKQVMDDIKNIKQEQEHQMPRQKAIEEYRKGNTERAIELLEENCIDEKVKEFWGK